MMQLIISIIIASSSLFFNLQTKEKLREYQKNAPSPSYEPTYLPKTKYLKLVSLGFYNFLSDLLWFKTNNYFGEEFKNSKDFKYLDLMCNLSTDLDPKDRLRFENCATLLAWIVKDPTSSNRLLDKAIKAEPQYWRYHYAKGFNNWYFFEDFEQAKNNFLAAAKLPDAPSFISGLASRLIAKTSSPKDALEFLISQHQATSSPEAKEALLDKIKKAELSYHLFELDKAADRYKKKHGITPKSFAEIIAKGFLKFVPKEPFGGKYILENGKAKHTSNETPLKFFGKSAKTGALKSEFRNFDLNQQIKE